MAVNTPEFRERLKRLRLAADRLAGGDWRGQRAGKAPGAGLEFAQHRAYSPGDDLRYLDWNVLGRLDTLVLKQFEAPGELSVVLAPDVSETMRFGEPEKAQMALELSAAAGCLALHAGDRVALNALSSGEVGREFFGAAAEEKLLAGLDRLESGQRGVDAGKWLSGVAQARGDVLVVMVTDFLDKEGVLSVLAELARLRARTLVLVPVAPQEAHPEMAGRTRLELVEAGGRGGAVTLEVTPAVLEDYRREFEQHRAAVGAACRRARAAMWEVSTLATMEDVLLGLVAAKLLRVRRS